MARHLSLSKRARIHELKLLNKSNKEIAKQFGVHPSTVALTHSRMDEFKTPYYVTPGRGRKPVLSERDLRQMKREVQSGRARNGADVLRNLALPVHPSTVRRKLVDLGLFGRACRRVLYRNK